MGLDMYLKAHRYFGGYKHNPDPERKIFAAVLGALNLPANAVAVQSPSVVVDVTVAYWRKANAIHTWFVKNCQEGKDECQDADVSREQLAELMKTCAQVLADPTGQTAMKLLPPQKGFFFGSTEIDDGYRQDLEDTIAQIGSVLACEELQGWDFFYHSSW